MTTRTFIVVATLLLASAPASAQPAPLEGFDDYVVAAMEAWDVPGLALAVVRGDSVLHVQGYGVLDHESGTPVGPDTRFAIGSNTKGMTATALGLLVESGRIAWGDRAIDLLDGFRLYDDYATANLTITDLLSHRSGLGRWVGDFVAWGSHFGRDEILRRVRYIEPERGFREGIGYSNLMYLAAGQVIPAVTDTTWDDYLVSRLFEPLGMKRTVTSVMKLSGDTDVATPYELIGGVYAPVPHRNLDNMGPAGSVYSTARDMARWILFQLGRGTLDGQKVADAQTIRRTWTPVTPTGAFMYPSLLGSYGLGWGLTEWRGRFLVWHGGGVDGMYSGSAFFPEEEVGVVVLTNAGGDSNLQEALVKEVLDRLLDGDPADREDWSTVLLRQRDGGRRQRASAKPARTEGTRTSRPLPDYTGRYVHQMYGPVEVIEANGSLVLRMPAHDMEGTLEHYHYDTFLATWSDLFYGSSLVTFTLGEDGKVSSFSARFRPDFIDPMVYEFEKAPVPRVSIAEFMRKAIAADGLEAASERYWQIKRDSSDVYNLGEWELNRLGYQYLRGGDAETAIGVFRLNVESFPETSNPYDSLGEAYLKTGQTEAGIANYKKSLELNPANDNARQILRQLGVEVDGP